MRSSRPDLSPADPRKIAASIPRSKDWPWYHESIGDKLTSTTLELLERYSSIAPDKAEDHVYQIRDMAWEIFPWPCIGEFWFISLGLSMHPVYPTVLNQLKGCPTARFLDLGTCLGQDLRKLIYDGVSPAQLYGSDLFPEYEAAGYALWRDQDRFPNHFIPGADIFATDGALAKTERTWDVVNIFMFLHVWDLANQKRACKRILDLLKPKSGSFVIGGQAGSVSPREFQLRPPFVPPGEVKTVYRHSTETFRRMWEEVGTEETTNLDIWVEYEDEADSKQRGGGRTFLGGDDNRRFFFLIKRL